MGLLSQNRSYGGTLLTLHVPGAFELHVLILSRVGLRVRTSSARHRVGQEGK
jgi:hypothetical protein